MNFINRHKKLFIVGIVILSVILIAVSVARQYKPTLLNNILGFFITPIQGVVTGVSSWFGDKIDFVVRMGEIEGENRMLKQQVEILGAENSRLHLVDERNQELSELLEITKKYSNYPMVGADVIAKDVGNWYDNFIIDKGTKDGFEKDMIVLASGGLVGRIFEAGYNYSKVKSIIDDTSAVAAKSPRTNDTGSMRGDLYLMMEGKCVMDFIDDDAQIVPGDEIVTSHLSSVFPPGIIIGNVLEVKNNANNTKQAIIKPYVDFKHLETVLVITQLFDRELIENENDQQ